LAEQAGMRLQTVSEISDWRSRIHPPPNC